MAKENDYKALTKDEALLFYKTCREFLEHLANQNNINIEDYLTPDKCFEKLTLQNIFLQIITSAANSRIKSGVIEFSNKKDLQRKNKILKAISGVSNLADEQPGLGDIQMRDVLCQLKELDVAQALSKLKKARLIKGERTITWERWLLSVQDTASFVLTFSTGTEFSDFFGQFQGRLLVLGPYFLSRQIYGLGIALSCDVLKDLGVTQLIKPDGHLKAVFDALDLVKEKNSDAAVVEAAVRLIELANEARESSEAAITPFELDKIIWLSCSGTFYKTPDLKISGQRDQLINRLRIALNR